MSRRDDGKIWKLPDIGFKIKVDAALDLRGNAFGIGVVIRNTFGVVVCVVSQFYECLFDVEVVEAQGIIAGISLTVGRGLSPCVIESDALMLCSCVEGLLFPDERLTIRFWTSAHFVTKWAIKHKLLELWNSYSEWLCKLVQANCNGRVSS
ncbi:hypothetical protein ACOSP7_002408 [Xanthoceras sorbifolium]